MRARPIWRDLVFFKNSRGIWRDFQKRFIFKKFFLKKIIDFFFKIYDLNIL